MHVTMLSMHAIMPSDASSHAILILGIVNQSIPSHSTAVPVFHPTFVKRDEEKEQEREEMILSFAINFIIRFALLQLFHPPPRFAPH